MNTFLILLFFGIFFALTWRKIEYGIFALVGFLPLYVIRFFVFGLPSTLLEGMILILFCTWLVRQRQKLKEKMRVFRTNKIFTGIVFLFVATSCVSVFVAPHIYAALGLWRAYIAEPILFFLVFVDTIHTRKQILSVCMASIISGCSIALYGILQKITGWGIPGEWIIERRITSIYPYPNAVGLYLAPILILAGTMLIAELSTISAKGIHRMHTMLFKKNILPIIIAIGVLFSAIVFAKTEAALVALAVSGLAFGFFWSMKSRRTVITLCAFALFFIVASPPLAKTLHEKIFLKDWSGVVRKSIWRETIPMIQNNWISGAGFSGYKEKMKSYHKDTFIEIFQYPHTVILNFWSEMGLLGLIAFELLVGWYFFLLTRTLFILRNIPQRDEKSFLRASAFGGVCAMSTIMIHGLVDVPYFKNDLSVFFWMLIGLAIAVYTNTERLRKRYKDSA